jgi:predicted MFS family arabinose efflux permease
MQLGTVAGLPIVEAIGRSWTWLAVAVWAVVFAAMCRHLARSALRRTRQASSTMDVVDAVTPARTPPRQPGGRADGPVRR